MAASPFEVVLQLTAAVGIARTLPETYDAALDGLRGAFGLERASILLFDPDGVMRFKAWRGLSPEYRTAVEGHTPWTLGQPAPEPVVVRDVREDPSLQAFRDVFDRERIVGLAFVPLVAEGGVTGKFMLYGDTPVTFTADELRAAKAMGFLLGFAVERTRRALAAQRARQGVLFALDAAQMGTWEWNIASNQVTWSENLERIHGLPENTFDGTFESYLREIHQEDRDRVLGALQRSLSEGTPHDVEYRIVAPDGTVRWVLGKGRVEHDASGAAVRMSGVCMDITARKGIEIDNARLYKQAQEANRLKDEFLATVSHELRTPLNVILGRTRMVLNAGDLETARENAAIVERNGASLARLVDDLLDMSRMNIGQIALERQPVHLAPVIESSILAVQPAIEAKRIALTIDAQPDLPPCTGDPTRIQQIVWNLLTNAVKFTPADGRIRIETRLSDSHVTLSVSDSGLGIAPDALPRVFDPFWQGEPTASRQHGGLGLGLSIVRRLVDLHGGDVRADSDGPGRGATFTITLPCSTPAAAAPSRAT
jgi:PAS domain S-box-containing protein